MNDRYQLRERLGAGGMSEVWRAHDQVLDRDVAVKVLAADAAADPARPARIRLEARAAAGLRHPHIVEVYDYGEAVDATGRARPYVVMELVEGTSLDDLLLGWSLPWEAATRISAQVASALAAAHARGVVHRDVKPGNVMVTRDGVKLVDFGISAAAGAIDEADGEVLGTPAYLAPERLDGGPVRVATDVYALGLLLYRALAGRLPWTGSTVTEMVGNHLYTDPAPLPRIAGLPPKVADLCRRALAKRPEDRPTAAEASRILSEAVGLPTPELLPLPTAAAQAGAPTVAIRPPRPRRRRPLPAAVAAFMVAVGSLRPRRSRRPVLSAAAEALTVAIGRLQPSRYGRPALSNAATQARSFTVAMRSLSPSRPRRPALLIAAAVTALAMLSTYTWWPSDAPRPTRAEAATAGPATASPTPGSPTATPPPKPPTQPIDRPTVRPVVGKVTPVSAAGSELKAPPKKKLKAKTVKKAKPAKPKGKSKHGAKN